jgi:glycosyltransferase involved in cell wall biosynthesis
MIRAMKISIGIFAYNEAARIASTLESLRGQDLFGTDGADIELIVLPNGCRDATAAVAEEALGRLFAQLPGVHARVENLPEPGKSRTWNRYVHDLADPAAGVLVFMDGDITLIGAATLRLLVEALAADPEAHASVDVILKDIAFKQDLTAREKMSLAASELTRCGPPKLAGSFYAVRGAVARGIWMPVGLLVEDGFLKAMLCTDNFTGPDTPSRLVRADGAAHTFEAVTDLRTLFKHEVRLLVGSAMNFILFEELTRQVAATGRDAGALVGEWNCADAGWPAALIDERLSARRGFLAPTGFILLPFRQLNHLPVSRALRRLPSAFLRAGFNLAAAVAAHGQLKRRAFRW